MGCAFRCNYFVALKAVPAQLQNSDDEPLANFIPGCSFPLLAECGNKLPCALVFAQRTSHTLAEGLQVFVS
jgi:hypothetical protein